MSRKERRAKVDFGTLKTAVSTKSGFKEDERIFKLKANEDGTGSATIRFLPAPDSQVPFVQIYEHGFKGPSGAYYIENCPTSINKDCPACKQNNIYWNNDKQDIAKDRKRKLSVYANILVIKDDNCPEREGKVFIYRFGKKILDKINDAINGLQEDPFNPFDYYEGANFILTQKIKDGYNNYDASRFKDQSPLDEEVIDIVDAELFDLLPFIDESKFKDYETLAAHYATKTGVTPPSLNGPKVTYEDSSEESTGSDEDNEESTGSEESVKTETKKPTGAKAKIFEKLKKREATKE